MQDFLAAYGSLMVGGLSFLAYFIGFALLMTFGLNWIQGRGLVMSRLDRGKEQDAVTLQPPDLKAGGGLRRDPSTHVFVQEVRRNVGVQIDRNILLFGAAMILTIGATIFVINQTAALIFIGAVVSAFVVFVCVIKWLTARRLRRFESQLPEAMDTIVRSLRAGHPTMTAIQLVAREFPKPLGEEFEIVANEIIYGLDLETALRNLAGRVRLHDLGMMVSSVALHARSGGNLSEIIGNLAEVVRQRIRLRQKTRAISAEGRFSALTLSLLPVVLFGALSFIAPGFYGEVWQSPSIIPIFIGAGLWMALGNFIMWRMVNFEA